MTLEIPDRALAALLQDADAGKARTPERIYLPEVAAANFRCVADRARDIGHVQASFSVKTNPRPELLELARDCGFFAECISSDELRDAERHNFPADRIVYNGPRPLRGLQAHIAFADSVESFERYCAEGISSVAGVRYRPSGIASRFGISGDDLHCCVEPARRAAARSVALHFHVRPEDYGARTWPSIALEALQAARQFSADVGKPLTYLDVGGGWTPSTLRTALERELPHFVATARAQVGTLQAVVIEPGQGIATPVEAVATRVLEVRRRGERRDAIVDAGYPDVPQIRSFAHRIFHRSASSVDRLSPGRDRIYGSTCLEYDLIAEGVALPQNVAAGDVLFIADAGAYDASMSFAFAHGRRSEAS